jgi:hypothetical protein
MNEEKSPHIPIHDPRGKKILALEARKQQLLQRKDQVRDSFVSKHIDVLLLEVEDLITKYDQSTSMPGGIKKEDKK